MNWYIITVEVIGSNKETSVGLPVSFRSHSAQWLCSCHVNNIRDSFALQTWEVLSVSEITNKYFKTIFFREHLAWALYDGRRGLNYIDAIYHHLYMSGFIFTQSRITSRCNIPRLWAVCEVYPLTGSQETMFAARYRYTLDSLQLVQNRSWQTRCPCLPALLCIIKWAWARYVHTCKWYHCCCQEPIMAPAVVYISMPFPDAFLFLAILRQ